MKIFELVESTPTITAPGNVVAPVGPGVKPSGSTPVPNTEEKPDTSNTPNILQPSAQPQPMGLDTSKPLPNQDQQDPAQPGSTQQAPVQQGQQPALPAEAPLTSQDFKSQMQALMTKLQQIQGQEPPPVSVNPQPGVSG